MLRRILPTVGTRSLLFGAHCFFIHPFFVAAAWHRLYGWNPVNDPYVGQVSLKSFPLWVAFFIHDWGYWGKPNMDGKEGELHTEFGAKVMSFLFDRKDRFPYGYHDALYGYQFQQWVYKRGTTAEGKPIVERFGNWGNFCLNHSRFIAKREERPYSALCVADKLSISLEPWWLYIPRATASREIYEYMEKAKASGKGEGKYGKEPKSKYFHMALQTGTKRDWFKSVCEYLEKWANDYKDLNKEDTHTSLNKPEFV